MPFTSVVTAAGGAGSIATTSADAARWARLLYTGEVLGPEMTARDARRRRGHGRLPAARPVRPRRPGVLDRRPADGRPQRAACSGTGRPMRHLPGRGDDDRGPDEPEPGRPGRDRPGACSTVVFAPEPPCLRCQTPELTEPPAATRRDRFAVRRGTAEHGPGPRSRAARVPMGHCGRLSPAHARSTLKRQTGMPIRVEAYTAGGVATGVVARSGSLREALDGAGDLLIERSRWLPLDGSGERPGGDLRCRSTTSSWSSPTRPRAARSTPSGTRSRSTPGRTAWSARCRRCRASIRAARLPDRPASSCSCAMPGSA